MSSSTSPASGPTTTLHGTVITDAPVRVVGPHNDGSDFYGIGLGLVAIVAAVAVTRVVFRRRGGSSDGEERR